MGCQVSIQHKTLPSTPALKSSPSKKTSLRIVYPGSTSESPNNYRSTPSRGRRSDAEFSILRSESRKSLGTIDNIKSDVTIKDKNLSPLIRIIGIGSPREGNMSEDSVKRSNESSEVSPNNRSPKRDFTFHSGENSLVAMSQDSMLGTSSNKQFSRYLSITPKPSEFFIQKVAGQGGQIVKRGTFGASSSIPADIKSEEEVDSMKKSHVKSMGEITVEQHSLHAADQEVMFPDTPAFRSMATNVSTQNHFDNTAENTNVEVISRRKDTFGYRGSGGELDLDKVVKKLETEKIKQEKIEKESKESARENAVLRGRLPNQQPHQQVITEKDETGSKYSKSSERNSTKTNRTTQTIILHNPDQEQEDDESVSQNSQRPGGSVYSLISSQLTGKNKYKLFLEETMKKMQVPQTEEPGQDGMKKVFTTNLLDLLSHRKEELPSPQVLPEQIRSPPEQVRSPIFARRQIKIPMKASQDFSEESNTLTLSLVSPSKRFEELRRRGIESPTIPGPLRFGTLENFRGGEMVSPIGHAKSGSATPYSNRTGKQANVSEIHDERTITNMDNLSRFDFDKYSFVAEVREVEVNQHTSHDESVGFRNNSRKFTANLQHMRSLESEETYRKIAAYLDEKGLARFDTDEFV